MSQVPWHSIIFATLNVSHCQSTSKNVLPYKVRDSMDGNLGIIFRARLDLISKQLACIMWDYPAHFKVSTLRGACCYNVKVLNIKCISFLNLLLVLEPLSNSSIVCILNSNPGRIVTEWVELTFSGVTKGHPASPPQ